MYVYKYKAKTNLTVLDSLFLEGDLIYVSESIYMMNGHFDYARKIFDSDKRYLGMIRDSKFHENVEKRLEIIRD